MGLRLPPVEAIVQERGGAFWVASARRLCRWTEGTAPQCLGPADGLPDGNIRILRLTADGALWIGTDAGLVRLEGGRVRVFTARDGLSGPVVRSLLVSADGTLWAGTGGRGLNRIAHADRPDLWPGGHLEIRSVRAADGLPDDVVYALVEDDRGRLWMSTNRGVGWATRSSLDAFLDGRAPRVYATLYTEADGLRNREGNGSQQAAIRARDGHLWFATQDGVATVDPAAVADGPPLLVRVEAVASGRRSWQVTDARQGVRLGASERSFEVAYTALAFDAEGTVFRYRLEGFDGAWVEGGTRRTAFYTNVPPGIYTFRVVARERDGRWAQAAPVAIRVAPFFYETWAFRTLVGLLLLGLAWGAVVWRTHALRHRERALGREVTRRTRDLTARTDELTTANAVVSRQAERLLEMDAAKNRLFANLSHEFRTPLTLILGPLQSGAEGSYGPLPAPVRARDALMLRNGRRLLRLVNQVLDLARLEAGGLTLNVEAHAVPAFVRQTALAFVPLAERQRRGGFDPYAATAVQATASGQPLHLADRIASLRAAGGRVMISFGGAASTPIAATCPSADALAAAYASVVDSYGVTDLDFDIEGTWVADLTSRVRRVAALVRLQQVRPAVRVWFTLPVLPTGLDANGISTLNEAVVGGVVLSGVNVMAMDYGSSAAPDVTRLGDYAIQAATAVHSQILTAHASAGRPLTDDDAWSMVGITPMIGVNDVATEVFGLTHARQIAAFAAEHHVGLVSMWSINRDLPCPGGPSPWAQTTCSSIAQSAYAFSQVFARGGAVAAEDGATGAVTLFAPTPNPGARRIAFETSAAGPARLTVVDLLGRDVAVLADRAFGAGRHEVALGRLPAGLYIVRLDAQGETRTRRVVVTR